MRAEAAGDVEELYRGFLAGLLSEYNEKSSQLNQEGNHPRDGIGSIKALRRVEFRSEERRVGKEC